MRNYQKELESLLPSLVGRPRLLLHACCAPCASYVLEYLSRYFEITVFFYNPNIYPQEEFFRRQDEAERLCKLFSVSFRTGDWDNVAFLTCAKGLEDEAEGGNRCTACYGLRLEKTAELARNENFDYFTTTLSISPHKNAEKLNRAAEAAARKYDVKNLPSDFKKKEGYKRSIILSKEYHLYRQDYCGCGYSKAARHPERKEVDSSNVCNEK